MTAMTKKEALDRLGPTLYSAFNLTQTALAADANDVRAPIVQAVRDTLDIAYELIREWQR